MRKVVIGAGFIGKGLIRHLLMKGDSEISVISRNNCPPEFQGKVEWISGCFSDSLCLDKHIRANDLIYNFVPGPANLGFNFDKYFYRDLSDNVEFLKVCAAKNVGKVIYASSAAVYGLGKMEPLRESDDCVPINILGVNKLSLEKIYLFARHEYGLDVNIVRIANAYGPDQTADSLPRFVPKLLETIRSGTVLRLNGGGNIYRDFVYIEDLAEALYKISNSSISGATLNIGGGVACSLKHVIETAENILNIRVNLELLGEPSVDIPYSLLDISLARELIGYEPRIGLEEGLGSVFRRNGLLDD